MKGALRHTKETRVRSGASIAGQTSGALLMRRLKAVKDLSVLIVAPRRHDSKLWADLLKNCGINHPTSMEDIKQAAHFIGSGQADVVFVDESYGAAGIANVLIPSRGVEFAGGRGVCLILCSKKATAADVLNARRLGFASLVILPASTDTVRKHLELAARYIPPTDEELGWSIPVKKEEKDLPALPDAADDPALQAKQARNDASPIPQQRNEAQDSLATDSISNAAEGLSAMPDQPERTIRKAPVAPSDAQSKEDRLDEAWAEEEASLTDDNFDAGTAPGRSGASADEEVFFL